MRLWKPGFGILVFLCLILFLLAGTVFGEYDRELMIVFTTDTNGELNPCG